MPCNLRRVFVGLSVGCLLATPATAQVAAKSRVATNFLKELSASVEALTRQVAASVVQILVTSYGPVEDGSHPGDAGVVIGRQRIIGSGAIIGGDGYIITNAHVIAGARQVQVVLHRDTSASGHEGPLSGEDSETVEAQVVGTAPDIDLALLKVDATGLRPLPLADYDAIRQGELVFAFGSPDGLRNSITMGVVSAVARQPDPDSQAFYVQTDAPINPGNSGGPLVNADGELVGLNTFILSESGGSQGLGFAIPSAVVASVYPQLRKYGHLHRGIMGFNMQSITPSLAAGLGLSRTSGVMVSDVMPGSSAAQAGLLVADVLTSVNDKPVSSLPMLGLELSRYAAGDVVRLGVLRGATPLTIAVPVTERPHPIDEVAGLADPEKSSVSRLGIVGMDVGESSAAVLPPLRVSSGVFVAARIETPPGTEVQLVTGDVIHAVNTAVVQDLKGLRAALEGISGATDLVLQIERDGRLMFVTCHVY